MVNPTHPATPHISAVRAWRFAQCLAGFGHRVVLLTGDRGAANTVLPSSADHAWREPLVLACHMGASPRGAHLPSVARKAKTAWRMLTRGGAEAEWVRAAEAAAKALAPVFVPDVLWTTFGQMEAVIVTRRVARRIQKPWVLDIKDNWELYVPRGLRRLMAWRVRGFGASTSNAERTRELAEKWLGTDARVIYSGVDDCYFAPSHVPATDRFVINLVGSLYFPDLLEGLLRGIRVWYVQLTAGQQSRVCLRHIGAQGDLVHELCARTVPGLAVEAPGYVSPSEMARLCQQAGINVYIHHSANFHHKLLELLACNRPVMAFPGESRESIDLAATAGATFFVPSTPNEVAGTFEVLSRSFFELRPPAPSPAAAQLTCYAWANQTRQLETVLAETGKKL